MEFLYKIEKRLRPSILKYRSFFLSLSFGQTLLSLRFSIDFFSKLIEIIRMNGKKNKQQICINRHFDSSIRNQIPYFKLIILIFSVLSDWEKMR